MNDWENERIKVEAQKRNRTNVALAVCLCLAAVIAVCATAGWYMASQKSGSVTVIYASEGETVSTLSASHERTVTEVVDAVADSVVEINCTVRIQSGWFSREGTSAGSGVMISDEGNIITNHHVVEGASRITVRLRSGKEYAAKLVGSDSTHDIAVLKISIDNPVVAVFGDSDSLRVGQTAIVIGNPLGTLGGTVTDGIISALDRDIEIDGVTMRLLQTNASINSGNSGGGMFDLDGRLIGIVNAKSTGSNVEGLGFAIPSNTALEVATQILSK